MGFVAGHRERPIDFDAIGHFERFAAVPDRERHRIKTRPKIDVARIGRRADLSVAKIPMELGALHRKRLGRGVAERNDDKRQRVVGQGHVAGDFGGEIRRELGFSQHDVPGLEPPDAVRVKNFGRDEHGPPRLGLRRIDFPRGDHRGVRPGGGMIILEPMPAGRKLHVVPAARPGMADRTVAPGAAAAGLSSISRKLQSSLERHEAVGSRLFDVQIADVAAQERLAFQAEGIAAVEDVFDVIGADRRGGLEGVPHGIEASQIARPTRARRKQQTVAAGPRRPVLARPFAAVKDFIFRLALDRLKRQPAEIARPNLQNPKGRQFVVFGDHRDVLAARLDFAVVQKLDDDDRVGFSDRHVHRSDGAEFGSGAAKRLARGRCGQQQANARRQNRRQPILSQTATAAGNDFIFRRAIALDRQAVDRKHEPVFFPPRKMDHFARGFSGDIAAIENLGIERIGRRTGRRRAPPGGECLAAAWDDPCEDDFGEDDFWEDDPWESAPRCFKSPSAGGKGRLSFAFLGKTRGGLAAGGASGAAGATVAGVSGKSRWAI